MEINNFRFTSLSLFYYCTQGKTFPSTKERIRSSGSRTFVTQLPSPREITLKGRFLPPGSVQAYVNDIGFGFYLRDPYKIILGPSFFSC